MFKIYFLLFLFIILVLTIKDSIFSVTEVNKAVVLQFGELKRSVMEPGLYFKIPFIQNVVYFEKRIIHSFLNPIEVILSDQKRLIVSTLVMFKISDLLQFFKTVRDERVATSRLNTIIDSKIRDVLSKIDLQTFLSQDRSNQMSLIKKDSNINAQKLGINIVDVILVRFYLPESASKAIYIKMNAESNNKAQSIIDNGNIKATKIRVDAKKDAKNILSKVIPKRIIGYFNSLSQSHPHKKYSNLKPDDDIFIELYNL